MSNTTPQSTPNNTPPSTPRGATPPSTPAAATVTPPPIEQAHAAAKAAAPWTPGYAAVRTGAAPRELFVYIPDSDGDASDLDSPVSATSGDLVDQTSPINQGASRSPRSLNQGASRSPRSPRSFF